MAKKIIKQEVKLSDELTRVYEVVGLGEIQIYLRNNGSRWLGSVTGVSGVFSDKYVNVTAGSFGGSKAEVLSRCVSAMNRMISVV